MRYFFSISLQRCYRYSEDKKNKTSKNEENGKQKAYKCDAILLPIHVRHISISILVLELASCAHIAYIRNWRMDGSNVASHKELNKMLDPRVTCTNPPRPPIKTPGILEYN